MELIENLLQLLVTFLGACLAGFTYGGAVQYIAYALPVLLLAAGRWSVSRLSRRK